MRNLFSLAFPTRGATPLAHPLAALGLLLATAGAAQAQTTTNFTYTAPGSPQTYTVPAGITKLNVVATGGGGGGNRGNNRGGLGAVVQATVTVVPGEVLTIVVGSRGVDSNNNGSSSVGGAGGYNGGGNGSYTGGGGGGATDLRRAAAGGSTGDYFTSRNALLVAGGGGAADSGPAGGAAGTPNGGNGVSGQGGPAGQGATTTALGGGYLGSNGTGGNGNPNNFNAAGGGGYYGGGGAGGPAGSFATGLNGGGGGSSYVLPTGSSNVSYSLAGALGNGALTITTVPTPTNNALAFDGSNDYVSLGSPAVLSNLGPGGFTLEAWVYYDGRSGASSIIRKTGDYNLYINNGVLGAEVWPQGGGNAAWRVAAGSASLAANRWNHVAATWTPATSTFAFYVNGVADPVASSNTGSISGSEGLSLGASTTYGNYLGGRLDEVRIYNTPLTAAQVQADMFSTSSALPGSQKYYANFDQGTAGGSNAGITSLTDQSGNTSTGTLNNFALTGTSSNWVRSFPTITGITPTTGNIGSSVTVTGTNLTDATGFAFNGTAVSPFTTPAGDLTATVAVPSGATTGPVSVSSATLARYNGPTFTVTYPDLVVNTTATIPAGTYNSITVNSPGVATLGGNVTVNTSLTVGNGATLNDGCFVLSGAGDFTLASGGTLGICNAQGLNNITGMLQNTGFRSLSIDATYVYNGTGAQVTGGQLPYQVRNLTSTNSNTVTLSQALSVAQAVTLNAGSLSLNGQVLTLLSSASGTALVANLGAGFINGSTVTVQRYIDPSLNAGLGYRHLAAPVAGATVAAFGSGGTTPVVNSAYNSAAAPGTVTPFPTIFSYDQSRLATSPATTLSTFDKGWVSPTALSQAANLTAGFTVQLPGASTLSFTGQVGNSTGTIPLSRASGATAADAGLNLIGNPYPAPLDLSTITAGQRTNVDAAFYVFESTSQYGGNYRSYVNGVASTGGSSLVGTAQAFFARVTAGQTSGGLALSNANRITTFSQQAPVRRTAEMRPLVRLALQGTSGPADTFTAYAQDGATAGFDGEYDAAKLPNPTGLNLSSATATDNLAIDGRAAFTPATVLALSVGVPAAGTYSLSAASLANLPAGLTPTLRDAATGQLTPLTAGTAYRFSVTAAEATALLTNRFTLQFSSATALATTASLSASEVTVYPNPAHGRFTVLVPAVAAASAVQAELLNTLGQVVRRQSAALPAAGATLTVETAGLASGVYTLRLVAGTSTLAKRVVLQ